MQLASELQTALRTHLLVVGQFRSPLFHLIGRLLEDADHILGSIAGHGGEWIACGKERIVQQQQTTINKRKAEFNTVFKRSDK